MMKHISLVRWSLGSAALVVLASGVGVVVVRERDSATPVSLEDAVGRFQASASSMTTPGAARSAAATPSDAAAVTEPAAPDQAPSTTTTTEAADAVPLAPPGVYTYATSGGEDLDVLGGAHHDYPDRTTITITPTECGERLRWDALEERWDEMDTCATPAGETLTATRQHHEFFDQTDQREYLCDGGVVRPAADAPGTTWRTTCADSDTQISIDSNIVGVESILVGDVTVETTHLQAVSTITGSVRGTARNDVWARRSDGLIVRRIFDVESETDSPVGIAHYQEHYQIDLTSLEPRT